MRVARTFSIVVVSLASFIVVGVAAVLAFWWSQSRSEAQQNFAPPAGEQAISTEGDAVLVSQTSGESSFLFRRSPSGGTNVRLTAALKGIESEASFSHDGKLVVYSFASSPDSKSEIWLVGIDGSNPHAVTSKDEDALHPAFSPNDSMVFYAASSFTGNHSPIVRPARHDWDVFSIPIQASGASQTQITHQSFYDLRSLDISADALNPGGTKLLISTTGYPIGALFEEFNLGAKGRDKTFQPHVVGAPSIGP